MQGEIYIQADADKWFDRNKQVKHNCFTEYLLSLFSKKSLNLFDIAEFGVGHGTNINLLSHYANTIDGYDGSQKSIDKLNSLNKINPNINGKRVNLGSSFESLNKYDLIIYGFFTYMITNDEFTNLITYSKKMLKAQGYIFIYDFLSKEIKTTVDIHNNDLKIHKRNFNYYLDEFKDFDLIDFRLHDNRNLRQYLENDNSSLIDSNLDSDDYNWTFSALFKMR